MRAAVLAGFLLAGSCAAPAANPPVRDVLQVTLRADRDAVRPGETFRLTTTLRNVTDDPVRLLVGWSILTEGNVFRDGRALQRLDSWHGDDGRAEYCGFGMCGTGRQPVYRLLPPRSSQTWTTEAEYHRMPPDRQQPPRWPTGAFAFGPVSRFSQQRDVWLDVDPEQNGGRVRLRVHWCFTVDELEQLFGASPDVWQGTLTSNTVEIALLEAR